MSFTLALAEIPPGGLCTPAQLSRARAAAADAALGNARAAGWSVTAAGVTRCPLHSAGRSLLVVTR